MSETPIRDRVRARKRRELLVRINLVLAAINIGILICIVVFAL